MLNLKPVKLEPEDQAAMRNLTDKTQGVQRMIQMFVESGERRLAELQQEGRVIYEGLAGKYKLDLKHVNYIPSPDFKTLIPTTVQLEVPNGTAE